jgi:glycosyltransferase involved in cell wall biosynthesis
VIKVAYCFRVDGATHHGGDVVQIEKTIAAGRKLGLFDGQLIFNPEVDLRKFDIVHLTNLDRPVDLLLYLKAMRGIAKERIFLSSIHHSYSEIERFEKSGRGSKFSALLSKLNFRQLELLRSFVRSAKFPSLFFAALHAVVLGVDRLQRDVLSRSKLVFVLSKKEQADILCDTKYAGENFALLRNAFLVNSSAEARDSDARTGILCVGRIEPRKNQLRIIEAVLDLGLKVTFIGALNGNHGRYGEEFLRVVGQRSDLLQYVGPQSGEVVANYMRRSLVHVSASWFEVASLVDLEAAGFGCAIVTSHCGSTNEVLGGNLEVVDPSSVESIRRGILSAYSRGEAPLFLVPSWSWDDCALELSGHYKSALNDLKRVAHA